MLAVQPSDSMIDEVLVQHQGRIPALQIHWLGAVIERGPELIGFRTDEAIKFFEAETCWPMRKGARHTGFVPGHIMMLAKPCGAVAIAQKNAAYRRGCSRYLSIVARKPHGNVGQRPCADTMMVAAGQQRSTGWRTHSRSDMHTSELQSLKSI